MTAASIANTPSIIQAIKNGEMVILIDDEDRENEGDIVIAADFVRAEHINFMAKHARGLICLTLTPEHCEKLHLPLMVTAGQNGTQYGTNFTMSIEAASGVTTGISAHDRAHTIQTAIKPNVQAHEIVQPGHVFPLRAQKGGVLVRAGHTEAGCDLAALADLTPAAVICEIMNDDGSMARLPDLLTFAQTHGLKIGTIADLIQYRLQSATLIDLKHQSLQKTPYGDMQLYVFQDRIDQNIHMAWVRGSVQDINYVRVHEPTDCLDFMCFDTGHSWDLLNIFTRSEPNLITVLLNCTPNAEQFLEHCTRLEQVDAPAKVNPSSRGDIRTYGIGAQILQHLGVQKMHLFTKPRKLPSLAAYGLEVLSYIEM